MPRKKNRVTPRRASGVFQPLPPTKKQLKARLVQERYESGKVAYLNSAQYRAETARRDAAFAEAEEWKRIRAMMKGAEHAPDLDDATREMFGLE